MTSSSVPTAGEGAPNLSRRSGLMDYEEALAKAKAFASTSPIGKDMGGYELREFEKQFAKRLQFEALFNEWLRVRGAESTGQETDAENEALAEREDRLAHLILTTPAPNDWQMLQKFEVIEHLMTRHADVSPGELMALTAFNSIKADILRHGIIREQELENELVRRQERA